MTTWSFGPYEEIVANEGPILELELVLVADIDSKLGAPLMKSLIKEAPMQHLSHLKRIRKGTDAKR